MIEFRNVTKQYPAGPRALDRVSLKIDTGEFVLLTGPSGAGKTTLLRLIYREDAPTHGSLLVAGTDVAKLPPRKIPYLRRRIGIVFQDFRLIDRRTVLENITYLPRILGMNRLLRRRLAFSALRQVGLIDRIDAFPHELSGGEQQRIAIARALVNQPKIVLADEPTGNLDPHLSHEIFELFSKIGRSGTTVVLATHDPVILEAQGVRRLTLERGRLVDEQKTTPEARDRRASRGRTLRWTGGTSTGGVSSGGVSS